MHMHYVVTAEPTEAELGVAGVENDAEQVDVANALDLSESEEEEEMENIFNDFAMRESEMDTVNLFFN